MRGSEGQKKSFRRYQFYTYVVGLRICQNLKGRLSSATCQDQRFIFDALGATIIALGDGNWELDRKGQDGFSILSREGIGGT